MATNSQVGGDAAPRGNEPTDVLVEVGKGKREWAVTWLEMVRRLKFEARMPFELACQRLIDAAKAEPAIPLYLVHQGSDVARPVGDGDDFGPDPGEIAKYEWKYEDGITSLVELSAGRVLRRVYHEPGWLDDSWEPVALPAIADVVVVSALKGRAGLLALMARGEEWYSEKVVVQPAANSSGRKSWRRVLYIERVVVQPAAEPTLLAHAGLTKPTTNQEAATILPATALATPEADPATDADPDGDGLAADEPLDQKRRRAIERLRQLEKSNTKGARQIVAREFGINVRTVGKWLKKVADEEAESKKSEAFEKSWAPR